MTTQRALSPEEAAKLDDLVAEAEAHPGFATDRAFVGDVQLVLRMSPWPWPLERDGAETRVLTLDVVSIYSRHSINHRKWTDGELDVSGMPRGLGAPIYAHLERTCLRKGRALRIECVISPRLRRHYVEKCGFVLEGAGAAREFSTSVIKIVNEMCVVSINKRFFIYRNH